MHDSRALQGNRLYPGHESKRFVKIFHQRSDGFVICWFSSVLRCGQTETAFRHFETPFLRAEVPLVNAETGPLPGVCQDFLNIISFERHGRGRPVMLKSGLGEPGPDFACPRRDGHLKRKARFTPSLTLCTNIKRLLHPAGTHVRALGDTYTKRLFISNLCALAIRKRSLQASTCNGMHPQTPVSFMHSAYNGTIFFVSHRKRHRPSWRV